MKTMLLLLRLPRELREVIEAIYFDGLTQREIADEFGIGVDSVRARRDKALAILRRLATV
jgi:RNA polymerase sigma factor (sigma-70 family)